MILALVLLSIALASQPSFGYPLAGYGGIDTALISDLDTDYYPGPWSPDFLRGRSWWGGPYGRAYDVLPDSGWDVDYAPYRTVDGGSNRVITEDIYSWNRDRRSYPTEPRRFGTTYYWPVGARRSGYNGIGYGGIGYGGIGLGFGPPRVSSVRNGGEYLFMRR